MLGATECQRQGEQMICPLCRSKWKETSPSDELSNSQQQSATTVPNNTRSASPSRSELQEGDDNGNQENVCVVANQVERWTEVSYMCDSLRWLPYHGVTVQGLL